MSRETDPLHAACVREIEDAKSKQRRAEEELKSFKQRMAPGLSRSVKAGDTENITSPVNKSRLQDMYKELRLTDLPNLTKLLKHKENGNDPSSLQRLIQETFQEAAGVTSRQLGSLKDMLRGKSSRKDLPQKVREHVHSCRESLQMAFYHCNKQDLHCAAVERAPEVCREFLSQCHWLGCLMSLNNPPLQPDWDHHEPGMNPWEILPDDFTRANIHPPDFATNQSASSERAVSVRSDSSRIEPPVFSPGSKPKPGSGPDDEPRPSSVCSDWSMDPPIAFRDSVSQREWSAEEYERKKQESLSNINRIFQRLEKDIVTFVKVRLQDFQRLLTSEQPQRTSEWSSQTKSSNAVLSITLDFLKKKGEQPLVDMLQHKTSDFVTRSKLKTQLQKKFRQVHEGVAKPGSSARLQDVYTDLYITKGGISEVNQEHEVRYTERMCRKSDHPVSIKEILHTCKQGSADSGAFNRTTLTMGVAGVGKTFLTQKFSLDWADDKDHQDIDLLFPFAFRELSVHQDRLSLAEFLRHFFPGTKGQTSFEDLQVLFILDGLDECRRPLDFKKTRVLTRTTESASVEELLVNLIRGDLLPSAQIWITTRPAAANQIPAECVSMVTEVRGFNNEQKEQYFLKRFRDEKQASDVLAHIRSIPSLFIMSFIPIFCWIVSTVHLDKDERFPKTPKTLTQMYSHFLVIQAKVKNIKYQGRGGADYPWIPETVKVVWALAQLAFEQLMKGQLIFYESEVSACGLEPAQIAQSGVFTEIFIEESGLYQNKVYSFIHLTVQEFLAALHVHQTFFTTGVNLLCPEKENQSAGEFYRSAIDLASRSSHGHFDMFLRFLLGLSLSTNQELLKGLLTHVGSKQNNPKAVEYIKESLNKGLSADRSLNLLHCLNELNDKSLLEETERVVRGGALPVRQMSPADWSAVSFLLLSSDLKELDLRKYRPSEEGLRGLMPAVRASNKAILSCCNLTGNSLLTSVLRSPSLTHLDLSNNDLEDSGVGLLCEGLKSAPCRLETLRLSGCLITNRGGAYLASALSASAFTLKELDLSYNHPGASSRSLSALQAPQGPLQTLRLEPAGDKWLTPGLRKYSCDLSLDANTAVRSLKLSKNKRTVTLMEEEWSAHNRFGSSPDVFCSQALTGHSYWEVNVDMDLRSYESVCIALSRDKNSEFGANKASWAMEVSKDNFSLIHDGTEATLSLKPEFYRPPRSAEDRPWYRTDVAVYLDHTGGTLSFYGKVEGKPKDQWCLLHTFFSSFTQPLFVGFRVNNGSVSLAGKD